MIKKAGFINKLMEKTNKSEEECTLINNILEDHFVVGRNNKDKIKKDFIEKLNLSEDEADQLYNTCSELIVKGIFTRK